MNIELNGPEGRFSVHRGDIRDRDQWAPLGLCDLVTGAPPFMPIGSGIEPQDAQRAAGRFEHRGGVEEYFETAAGKLTSDGRAVVLMDGQGRTRSLEACRAAGLHPVRVIDILPRPG